MTTPAALPNAAPASESGPTKQPQTLIAGLLAVGLTAVFLGLIFNRYLTIHEGWFHYYAQMMRDGRLPYRDFYFFGQPIPLLISWLFGGDHLINLRVFGLVEHVGIAAMLYFLLSREFSPMASFWATLLSITVLITYRSDSLFSYLYDSLFCLIAGMIFVYLAHARPRRAAWFGLLAGVSASLSFFTKQSTGFFATLTLAILIGWLSSSLGRVGISVESNKDTVRHCNVRVWALRVKFLDGANDFRLVGLRQPCIKWQPDQGVAHSFCNRTLPRPAAKANSHRRCMEWHIVEHAQHSFAL
jgi:hypothetical protein